MRGPKFYIAPEGNKSDFCGSNHIFTKKLITHEKFFDQDFEDKSLFKIPSKKHISTDNKELSNIISVINKIEPRTKIMENNLNTEERKGLDELQTLNKTIIEIKKADKSNTFVIMDKDV